MKKQQKITPVQAFKFLSNTLSGSGINILNRVDSEKFPLDIVILHSKKNKFEAEEWHVEPTSIKALNIIMKYLDFMSNYFCLDRLQTVTLVIVISIQINSSKSIGVDRICEFLKIGAMDGCAFRKVLDNLDKTGYLTECYRFGCSGFLCQNYIIESIFNNMPFMKPNVKKFDRYCFCTRVDMYICQCSEQEIETQIMVSKIRNLEQQYKDMQFVKKVNELLSCECDRIFFYEICSDMSKNPNKYTSVESTVADMFDNPTQRFGYANRLIKEQNDLFSTGLVELIPSSMANNTQITLSDFGKHIFFEDDYDLFCNVKKNDPSIIISSDIKNITLFYDDEFNQKANSFRTVMVQGNFETLQNRLRDMSMPIGVSAIFYGAPGTGKTELVKQIARETGRSIMHVDISQVKSCWVGESEKRVKNIFVRYRRLCQQEKLKPILLFNEADAIFSKRMDASSSQDSAVVQMLNAMQNIILEEMETLDGILIATTNLHGNMDDAFSRRFLYKLEFHKPSTKSKISIWKNKLPKLSDTDAANLASRYDLSGGEIDNVVRKSVVEEVTSGRVPDYNTLCQFCESEKFNKKSSRKVGFNV